MLEYGMKLLELKSIIKNLDSYYLHINLFFEEGIEIFLEVDEYTATDLEKNVTFDDSYKYRLSLSSSFSMLEKQHTTTVAKTYKDQSESIAFLSSEDYIDKLSAIKNIRHISDLSSLNFIHYSLPEANNQEEEATEEIKEEKQKFNIIEFFKSYINKPKMQYITAISFIFVILFIFLTYSYLNMAVFNKGVLAQTVDLHNETDTDENQKAEEMEKVEDNLEEGTSFSEPVISYIKLDDTLTYSIPKGNVALTFDDGPSKYTTEIVDILKEYNVGGTFFFIGYNIKKYSDHVRYVSDNNYPIGSHSMTHTKLPNASNDKQKYEILESIELLEDITNTRIELFRPPYGSYTNYVKALLKSNQYKMVLWDVDPRDWETRSSEQTFNFIQNSDASGSIILLHESQNTVDILPAIIEYLQGLDLQIVGLR